MNSSGMVLWLLDKEVICPASLNSWLSASSLSLRTGATSGLLPTARTTSPATPGPRKTARSKTGELAVGNPLEAVEEQGRLPIWSPREMLNFYPGFHYWEDGSAADLPKFSQLILPK